MLEEASPAQTGTTVRIESMLSNRLFVAPQLVGDRLYFVSNLSGKMSLYVMDRYGSVPEPLLPPDVALQNPELIDGYPFFVFPKLDRIVVMIDKDGDENYEPMMIPSGGGMPVTAFGNRYTRYRSHLMDCSAEHNLLIIGAESREQAIFQTHIANLETGDVETIYESQFGGFPAGVSDDYTTIVLTEGYLPGDTVVFLWGRGAGIRRIYGIPLGEREPGQVVPPNSIAIARFVNGDRGILVFTSLFEDTFGLGYIDLDTPDEVKPVAISGMVHSGAGQFDGFDHVRGDRFRLDFNIDGASWVYEGVFDLGALELTLDRVLVGEGELANGTLEGFYCDKISDSYALSFSTATSPTQLYTLEGLDRTPRRLTNERVLGIPQGLLAPGEDASFTSHDGLRISARLYLPSPELGFEGARPLVYYIHGGPQSQERPNFAWFSMPLIQFLTLNGFAVYVPNVRGSSGYGLDYMKRVDHDWGGQDRLDHVYVMEHVLPHDARVDVTRAGVMGRSYGGYMTLTLASRHPELWRAAIDMFGPYDLFTFGDRLPETWKPYMKLQIGDPETEGEFLRERSPATYFDKVNAPLLVIQGKNDPRVVEQESRAVVERLRAGGHEVEYLMFENEGHDVLKFENRVRCYNAITEFFREHLE